MDRSVKLLNLANVSNNYLVLYTELNHTFNIGENVYIVGGYYDNVNNLQFNNPYTTTKYKIIAIDNTINSFTIDYFYNNPNDVIFPYGNLTNQFGDETDTIQLAYNNYTSGMYKGVYVSKCVINNGFINSGTINNGICGSDENEISINNTNIRHIISKKTNVKNTTITDKLFNTQIQTRKFVRNIFNSPTLITNVPTSPNNNGYGYSVFESIRNLNDNITINGNEFINQMGQIDFNFTTPVEINNSKFGNNDSLTQDNVKISGDVTFNNCLIHSFKFLNNNFKINNSKVNTYKDIKCTGITINGTGDITFNVDYSVVENNTFINGTEVSIINLWYNPTTSYDALRKGLKCTITDSGYTFNNASSGFIRVNITNTEVLNDWATYVPFITSAILDEIKLSTVIKPDLVEPFESVEINNSEVFGAFINDKTTLLNNKVNGGYYNNIRVRNNEYVGIDNDCVLKDVIQLVDLNQVMSPRKFDRVYVNTTKQISGKFDNFSVIDDGTIIDSELNNTIVNNINSNTFIYNTIIKRDITIDSSVFYDRIKFEENALSIVGNSLTNINFYPEGRASKWVTGLLGQQLPVLNDYATNVNSLQNGFNNQYYERYKVDNGETLVHAPNLQHLIDIPNSVTQFASKWYFIANKVESTSSVPVFWKTNGFNMSKSVLYSGQLNPNNLPLYNALINRTDYIESGVYTHFTGASLPVNNQFAPAFDPIVVIQVDDNFVYNKPQNNILSNEGFLFHDIVCDHIKDTPDNFPDYTVNEPNIDNIINIVLYSEPNPFLEYTLTNNDNINIISNSPVPFVEDFYNIHMVFDIIDFKNQNNQNITHLPAPFIEIEYVQRHKLDNTPVFIYQNNNNVSYKNYVPPYTGSNNNYHYALDNIIASTDFQNNFKFETIRIMNGQILQYKIVYWITWWYENESYTVGAPTPTPTHITNTVRNGHRTRHEFNFTVTGV